MLSFYEYFFGYFSGYGILFALILRINDDLLFSTLLFGMALPVFMVASRDKSPVVINFFNNQDGPRLPGSSKFPQENSDTTTKKLSFGNLGGTKLIENVEFMRFCEGIETKQISYSLCSILWLPGKLTSKMELILKCIAIRISDKK